VISAGAVRGLIAEIIDDYSRQTARIRFHHRNHRQLRTIIASGQHADLIIVSTPLMGELEKTGKLTPGSRAELGRVGIGVTVREGVTVPDVLDARRVEEGPDRGAFGRLYESGRGRHLGIYFTSVAERFGIGDEIKKKAVLTRGGREAAIEGRGRSRRTCDRVHQRGPQQSRA